VDSKTAAVALVGTKTTSSKGTVLPWMSFWLLLNKLVNIKSLPVSLAVRMVDANRLPGSTKDITTPDPSVTVAKPIDDCGVVDPSFRFRLLAPGDWGGTWQS
jgi:hypothetical protein